MPSRTFHPLSLCALLVCFNGFAPGPAYAGRPAVEKPAPAAQTRRAGFKQRVPRRRTRRAAPRRCEVTGAQPAAAGPKVSDALVARARSAGGVVVVVRLCVPFASEGELAGPAAVRRQRAAIARTQDALLAGLSRFQVASVKRFKTIPYVSLVADDAALLHMRGAAGVHSVREGVSVPLMR